MRNDHFRRGGAVDNVEITATNEIEEKGSNGDVTVDGGSARLLELEAQLRAIDKAQAMIEFEMDGTIIWANENFLQTLGYTLEKIRGQHHRMVVDEVFAAGAEYRAFLEKLNRGEYVAEEYQWLGKGGKEAWIQTTYNRPRPGWCYANLTKRELGAFRFPPSFFGSSGNYGGG